MNNNHQKFIHWEQASRDTLDVKRVYIDMAQDLVSGIVLSQIIYWFLPNRRGQKKTVVERDGKAWIAKEYKDWFEECRVSPEQAKRAVERLEELNLIESSVHFFGKKRMKHITVNWDMIVRRMNELLKDDFDLYEYWKNVNLNRKEKSKRVNDVLPFGGGGKGSNTSFLTEEKGVSPFSSSETTLSETTLLPAARGGGQKTETELAALTVETINSFARPVRCRMGQVVHLGRLDRAGAKPPRLETLHEYYMRALWELNGKVLTAAGRDAAASNKLVTLVESGKFHEDEPIECLIWLDSKWSNAVNLMHVVNELPKFKMLKDSGEVQNGALRREGGFKTGAEKLEEQWRSGEAEDYITQSILSRRGS